MQSMTRLDARPACPAARRSRAGLARPSRPAGCRRRTARSRSLKNCERSASDAGADAVEHLDRQAAGIGGRLQHQRRHRADQHGLRHALRAVAADVARHLAAAGRVADVDGVLQIERFDQRREIVGVGVHVVAVPGLARAAVAAAVVGDAAVAVRRQEEHLVLPGVGAQRPAVAEDDGLPGAPVLVVDLRAVFRGDRAHRMVSHRSWLATHGQRPWPRANTSV